MLSFSQGLVDKLKNSEHVAVLTGAGISAESGVATFRGEEGLWKKFSPEEMANFDAFMKNPELVWEWYNWRKKLMVDVGPNPGHTALAALEEMVPDFWLITQNVDGLHHQAGSKNILTLHGDIFKSYCVKCKKDWDEPVFKDGVPTCDCGGMVRPDVVWFGESLNPKTITKAYDIARNAQVFFSIGTSAHVVPAAHLPLFAKENGAYIVEINVEDTPLTPLVDEFIKGKSGEILPALIEELKK